MSKKTGEKLYEPRIPPERQVRDALEKRLSEQRNTFSITRGPGEQYFMTCFCGAEEITSDCSRPNKFAVEHKEGLCGLKT